MSEADDAELLSRMARGDREALDALVRRYQAPLFRYLRRVARDDADAEDALQEGFLAAWRGAGTFQGTGSARGWIFTVARNALRRRHRRRAGEPDDFESLETLGREAGWGREESGDVLERLTRRDLVERALARLDPDDREILILRDVEGFSGEEAAGMLELSVAAMKSRLHRARLRLTRALEELDHVGA